MKTRNWIVLMGVAVVVSAVATNIVGGLKDCSDSQTKADSTSPDAENPDAENPDAENPDAENPDAEKLLEGQKRLAQLPHVEKYSETKFDLMDTMGRMKRSEWNYFFLDQKNKFFAGYWEAEDGYEDLGTDSLNELLLVLEGKIYVQAGDKEYVAGPGDTVIVIAGRKCRVTIKEPIKSFFVCCPVDDPLDYEKKIHDWIKKNKPSFDVGH